MTRILRQKKSKRKDAATQGTAGQPNAEARAVASDLSDSKDNALSGNKQGLEAEKFSVGAHSRGRGNNFRKPQITGGKNSSAGIG
ncbi:MAG: hypothetical protein HDR48_03240 [Bacteroides sp.]|nr:hypothetical protein [Bacteroides sp.]